MITKILLFFIVSLSVFSQIKAQEVLTGLSNNPQLLNYVETEKPKESLTKGGSFEIHLPFRDDFSYKKLFPAEEYWNSRSVFVNRSYAVNPPSIGVVTFDAMDENGQVYSSMTPYPSVADTFTTQNIRLDSIFGSITTAIHPSDSVYLSFFVQAQGIGSQPKDGDSLVLQFYNPTDDTWKSIWRINGMSLDSFRVKYDTSFLQVMIPIKDNDYFKPNFKFRFYNYARIPTGDKPSWRTGLFSHWNLDYFFMDINRTYDDTTYSDMAIQTSQSSLLIDYQSMPWNQFLANPSSNMNYGLTMQFMNMDNIPGPKNVNQYFYIYDLWDKSLSFEPTPNPSSVNINSQAITTFSPDYSSYTYNSNAPEYGEFEVLYSIFTNTPPPDINTKNDTLSFYQKFYNYFAYDDGIPESGYGLSTSGGKLAYQFKLDIADSLQSIQMYFNQAIGNANQQYFYLTVWDDNNGVPGNIIYEKSGLRPNFEGDLFKFYTYELENAIYVSGTFYIGWRQTTKDNLNIGFDLTNNNYDKIFYNVGGTWYNSSFNGSIMMRPILGNEKSAHVSIKNNIDVNNISFDIYPNPNRGNTLNIKTSGIENTSNLNISIYNLQGQLVYNGKYKTKLQLNNLSSGLYIVRISNSTGSININKKLIINDGI